MENKKVFLAFFVLIIFFSIFLSSCNFENNKKYDMNNTVINNSEKNNSFNDSNFVEVKETVNTIINDYVDKKSNFSVYDPYNKILYYGFKIIKNNPCIVVLTEDKMTSLDKNYVDVNVVFENTKDVCIQMIEEDYIFRKSFFYEKPDVLRVYKDNNLILEMNVSILNLSYKNNIDSYEDLNSYCESFPEDKRVDCCRENSRMLPNILCVGDWVWEDGCKYKCGLEPIK